MEEFKGQYRCITMDLRNANGGQSSGPLEIERPWDAYADDQLGVMDHLGLARFLVMGFCIGGPFIWNLLRRAPDRIVALCWLSRAVSARKYPTFSTKTISAGPGTVPSPTRHHHEHGRCLPDQDVPLQCFVFTVTRDFVRACHTPILVLPDDIPAHPYAVAMEAALLAPKAAVSLYPWKEPKDLIPLAVRHVRTFLQAHRPATAVR